MSKPAVAQVVKILVPAGKATPSPPVGPALGARGVKAMDFCKEFNARTAHLKLLTPTPTAITINPDRTFTFTIRTPPVTHLLKTVSGLTKGSATPPSKAASVGATLASLSSTGGGKGTSATSGAAAGAGQGFVGKISLKEVYEIARVKCGDEDVALVGLEKVARGVVGSARSLGLEVVP